MSKDESNTIGGSRVSVCKDFVLYCSYFVFVLRVRVIVFCLLYVNIS